MLKACMLHCHEDMYLLCVHFACMHGHSWCLLTLKTLQTALVRSIQPRSIVCWPLKRHCIQKNACSPCSREIMNGVTLLDIVSRANIWVMAPSKQAKKEAAKLELPEDEEKFPRLNDTNRSEYEIVAEIDNDLQVMVDQGVLGPDEPVDVAKNVLIPHGRGTDKTTGDRLILLWYGYLAPHKKGQMLLTPEGQTKFRVRFGDGYDYMFKREEMMYSIPENIPFRINDGVDVPSDGTGDPDEECDDEDDESFNSEYDKDGDNEGNADNDGSGKKKAEKAAKKKVIRPKKSKAKYTKKTVGFKHVDMTAEMWARRISQCETHEEGLPLLEQAATEGKGYLLGVSANLSIPVATSKAIAEILRLFITRDQSGQMNQIQLFVDSNPTVSLDPSLLCVHNLLHSGSCNRMSLCTLFVEHFTAFIVNLLHT